MNDERIAQIAFTLAVVFVLLLLFGCISPPRDDMGDETGAALARHLRR
jgi:hypothetical protein